MREKFSKTLAVPVPASWDDTLNAIAGREFKPVTAVTRELILAGFRSRGLDPFAKSINSEPEAA